MALLGVLLIAGASVILWEASGQELASGRQCHKDVESITCANLHRFSSAPPFRFSALKSNKPSWKAHVKFVTASNGIRAIFKQVCNPILANRTNRGYAEQNIHQAWIEEYVYEIATMLGIKNAPCVQSRRFYLGKTKMALFWPECIFHDGGRSFVMGSITSFIPSLVSEGVPPALGEQLFGVDRSQMLKQQSCESTWPTIDVSNTLLLDALFENKDRKPQKGTIILSLNLL